MTPGTLIWVSSVVLDQAVFVRSANPESRWFAAALSRHAGIVEVGGVVHQVRFEHVIDENLRDRVDAAFARTYAADPYFSPEVLHRSRERIARITRESAGTARASGPGTDALANKRTIHTAPASTATSARAETPPPRNHTVFARRAVDMA